MSHVTITTVPITGQHRSPDQWAWQGDSPNYTDIATARANWPWVDSVKRHNINNYSDTAISSIRLLLFCVYKKNMKYSFDAKNS